MTWWLFAARRCTTRSQVRQNPANLGAAAPAQVPTGWASAEWIVDTSPLSAHQVMLMVGVIEIVAGVAVAIKPRYGAYIVAAWLVGIIVNLLSYPGFYDVVLRDFGLLLAALTLARLASGYDARGIGEPYGSPIPLSRSRSNPLVDPSTVVAT